MIYHISFRNLKINKSWVKKMSKEELWCYKKIIRDANRLPKKIIKMLVDNNIELYFTDAISSNGTYFRIIPTNDYTKKEIYLSVYHVIDEKIEKNMSALYHEVGHAIDNILINKKPKDTCNVNDHFSSGMKFRHVFKNRGLDSYAKSEPWEYFAVGFMSYFQKNIKDYKPTYYGEHNKKELKTRDLPLYNYIENIVRGQLVING